jgi:hypothetical protein
MRCLDIDIAAVASIAAIGRSLLKVSFAQKRDTAVSAVASVQGQKGFIGEAR